MALDVLRTRVYGLGVESFPYPQAILEWLSAKKRRGIK